MDEKALNYLRERVDSIFQIVSQLQKNAERPKALVKTNLIKVEDAMIITGYSKIYIYELIHKQAIPFIKRGRSVRFDKEELENWMRAGRPNIFKETIKSLKNKK